MLATVLYTVWWVPSLKEGGTRCRQDICLFRQRFGVRLEHFGPVKEALCGKLPGPALYDIFISHAEDWDADEKEKARPEKKEMPERIPDTPENIMRVLVETPPRKTTDWEYLKAEPPKLLQQQVREE